MEKKENLNKKKKLHPHKKIPPLINPLIIQNDNSKEKEIIKFSQRRLPLIEKPRTSDKFKEKSKRKFKFKQNKIEEKKNDMKSNNNEYQQYDSKEEPINKMKIKIISKIDDELYERLLNKQKFNRANSSESHKMRSKSLENLDQRTSLDLEDSEKKKKIKKKKFIF